jgi:hypothetical protein
MEELQKQVFYNTEKLIAKVNLKRTVILALITASLIVALLVVFKFTLDVYFVVFAILISLFYSFMRELMITRKSRKALYRYYNYVKEIKPNMDLYIPVFERTRQGNFLRKSALFFENKKLYMEAFYHTKSRTIPSDSITIEYKKDFALDQFKLDKKLNVVDYQARLSKGEITFSMVFIDKLYKMIR